MESQWSITYTEGDIIIAVIYGPSSSSSSVSLFISPSFHHFACLSSPGLVPWKDIRHMFSFKIEQLFKFKRREIGALGSDIMWGIFVQTKCPLGCLWCPGGMYWQHRVGAALYRQETLTQVVNSRATGSEVCMNSCVDHFAYYGLLCQCDAPACQRLTKNSLPQGGNGSLQRQTETAISIMFNMAVIGRKLAAFCTFFAENRKKKILR